MTIDIKIFLVMVSCFVSMGFGTYIFERNSNGQFKHNVLMGLLGMVFTIFYPIFICGICGIIH